jgi:hypothetical protein
MWNLVGAYYHGTNWYASSMLTSVQPWSGYVLPAVVQCNLGKLRTYFLDARRRVSELPFRTLQNAPWCRTYMVWP